MLSLVLRIGAAILVSAAILFGVARCGASNATSELTVSIDRAIDASEDVRTDTRAANQQADEAHARTRADLNERTRHASENVRAAPGANTVVDAGFARAWVRELASLRERSSADAAAGDGGSSAEPP